MKNRLNAKRYFCVRRDHWLRRGGNDAYFDRIVLAGMGAPGHTDYRYWVHLHMGWR
jgi:hypothetical protein